MKFYGNLHITKPFSDEGDGFRIEGETATLNNITIDFKDVPLKQQDEAISFTQAPNIIGNNLTIENVGKAFLCGRGDEESIHGGTINLHYCIIRNFGRRGPEVQDGMKVNMYNCLIENWGDTDWFTVRNFGAWAHHGAEIYCENCLFIQRGGIFKGGIIKFLKDVGNHIGICVNYKDFNLTNWFLPGRCRGLTSGKNGKVSAKNCYKNKWWIRIKNHSGSMNKNDAEKLYLKLTGEKL